jgi:AraC-like DNA-binding protein
MNDPRPELRDLVLRHAPPPAAVQLLPNAFAWTSPETTGPLPCVYEPLLYFALQGTKRLNTGDRWFEHGPGTFLISSVDVPVVCGVVEASPARPYAGVAIVLDAAVAAALLVDLPPSSDLRAGGDETEAMGTFPTTPAIEDALLRLLRLTEAPADIAVLGPMIERELLYRVLQSGNGRIVRQIAQADSRISQIHRAVKWIRAHLTEPLPVETLAGIASMSVSSFHRHFKAVTGLSPLAYHKQMRLQEARRRLLVEPGAVASVAFSVGYESASQFSREYARQFGMPPARDAARLRAG